MGAVFRQLRFTTVFVGLILLANLVAGTTSGTLPESALNAWGLSRETLVSGEVWRLFSSTFLSHTAAMLLRQLVFAALVIGYYEWHAGTRRAVLMFWGIDLVGTTVLLLLIIGPLSVLGGPAFAGADRILDVGMSAGGFGLLGAILAGFAWRWVALILVLGSILAKILVAPDVIADSVHLLTLLIGFAIEWRYPARPILREGSMKP